MSVSLSNAAAVQIKKKKKKEGLGGINDEH